MSDETKVERELQKLKEDRQIERMRRQVRAITRSIKATQRDMERYVANERYRREKKEEKSIPVKFVDLIVALTAGGIAIGMIVMAIVIVRAIYIQLDTLL